MDTIYITEYVLVAKILYNIILHLYYNILTVYIYIVFLLKLVNSSSVRKCLEFLF